MVVPVLVALGNGTPLAWRARLRLWLEKSKPAMVRRCVVYTIKKGEETTNSRSLRASKQETIPQQIKYREDGGATVGEDEAVDGGGGEAAGEEVELE